MRCVCIKTTLRDTLVSRLRGECVTPGVGERARVTSHPENLNCFSAS